MESHSNAINSSVMVGGALVLLGVLAWVTYTISQPLIPNTGGTATTTEESTDI